MRIAATEGGVEAGAAKLCIEIRIQVAARDEAVEERRLADDVLDAQARVERGVGVLEDHLHLEFGIARTIRRQGGDILALEQDGAVGRRHDAGDHPTECRLAAAGFAHQADDLPACYGEIDIIHGSHDLVPLCAGAKFTREGMGETRDGVVSRAEALRYAAQLDDRRGVHAGTATSG